VVPIADVPLPRLRQAVLAARELDPVADLLRSELGLGEPFADPGVAYFGLRNAVFALGDTFLEVVSPTQADTAAGRLLKRRGGDCGYMLMFEVDDLPAARARARAEGMREVFEVELPDISEVHLHPADMRGAIVSLSAPHPAGSWRWGGPGWESRGAGLRLDGARLAVAQPDSVAARWSSVLGAPAASLGLQFQPEGAAAGLVEVVLAGPASPPPPLDIGGLRLRLHQ
jgi:hypothetical protein